LKKIFVIVFYECFIKIGVINITKHSRGLEKIIRSEVHKTGVHKKNGVFSIAGDMEIDGERKKSSYEPEFIKTGVDCSIIGNDKYFVAYVHNRYNAVLAEETNCSEGKCC
jgi:hypothetical protein